jgi:hypothetical protein
MVRIASWANGTPIAKTRCSHFELCKSKQLDFATSVNIAVTRGNLYSACKSSLSLLPDAKHHPAGRKVVVERFVIIPN